MTQLVITKASESNLGGADGQTDGGSFAAARINAEKPHLTPRPRRNKVRGRSGLCWEPRKRGVSVTQRIVSGYQSRPWPICCFLNTGANGGSRPPRENAAVFASVVYTARGHVSQWQTAGWGKTQRPTEGAKRRGRGVLPWGIKRCDPTGSLPPRESRPPKRRCEETRLPPPPAGFSHAFVCVSATEIGRVRKDMYNDSVNGGMFNGRDLEELPEAVGPVVQLQEKLYVPVKEYPDVSGAGADLSPFTRLSPPLAVVTPSALASPQTRPRPLMSSAHEIHQ